MSPVELDDYLAACQEICTAEIGRLYVPGDEPGTGPCSTLILDYPQPRREGGAARP